MIKNIKNKIVITGGSGFIGKAFLQKLIKEDHKEIVIIDLIKPDDFDVKYIKGSFYDKNLLRNIINKGDIVIHLACTSVPSLSEKNRINDIKENVIGTINLLDICVEKSVEKFLFLSSGGTIYGDLDFKLASEDDCIAPINSHGAMKSTVENYIKVYNHLYGLKYNIFRVANPYGNINNLKKGQGVIDVLIDKVIKNEYIEVWGDGSVIRDYIFINDLTDFIFNVLESNVSNCILNIGSGVPSSINDIIKNIENILEKPVKIKYLEKRNFDLKYNCLSIKKAQDLFNWKPKVSLKEGIKKIYNEKIRDERK